MAGRGQHATGTDGECLKQRSGGEEITVKGSQHGGIKETEYHMLGIVEHDRQEETNPLSIEWRSKHDISLYTRVVEIAKQIIKGKTLKIEQRVTLEEMLEKKEAELKQEKKCKTVSRRILIFVVMAVVAFVLCMFVKFTPDSAENSDLESARTTAKTSFILQNEEKTDMEEKRITELEESFVKPKQQLESDLESARTTAKTSFILQNEEKTDMEETRISELEESSVKPKQQLEEEDKQEEAVGELREQSIQLKDTAFEERHEELSNNQTAIPKLQQKTEKRRRKNKKELIYSCRTGDAELNVTDKYESFPLRRNFSTPFNWAAFYGFVGHIRFHVDRGADVEEGDVDGDTALNLAAENGRTEVVRVLLTANASLHTPGRCGFTAMHWAALSGDLETIQVLISFGADVNILDDYKRTPLHLVAQRGYTEECRLLLKCNALVNQQNEGSNTPLHLAAEFGRLSVVKLLTEHKADTSLRNRDGLSALELAVGRGHTAVADYLKANSKLI